MKKKTKKEFESICSVETTPGTLYSNSKIHKIVVKNTKF